MLDPDRRLQREPGRLRRGAVGASQRVDGVVGVEAARVGQDPELGTLERFGLSARFDLAHAERLPVRGLAEHRDHLGPVRSDDVGQAVARERQLRRGHLIGSRGRLRDEVRDADADRGQLGPVLGRHPGRDVQLSSGDAGPVQRRPEPVPGPGEVRVRRCGPQSRVDPDDEQPQPRWEEVVDASATMRLELRPGEPSSRHGGRS